MIDADRLRANVPVCLRDAPQWLCWKYVQKGGKPTKVPVRAATLDLADATNPEHWTDFESALGACERAGELAGVGFAFAADGPFCGIDLDGCITDGQLSREAQELLLRFDTYSEISPSGTGVKLFIRGRKSAGARCKKTGLPGLKQIEVYDSKRFFAVTGEHVPGTSIDVGERQEVLDELCRRLWPTKPAREHSASNAAGAQEPPAGDAYPNIDMATRDRRCRKYIAKCPEAISGDGGHGATLRAACECFRFGLDSAAAWRVMQWFNAEKTGGEPWTERELQHKLESARVKVNADGEWGMRLRTVAVTVADDDIAKLTSDIGNAARLVRRYGDRIRYCHPMGQWFVWDGRRWKPDDRGRIVKLCKDTALSILDEAKKFEGGYQAELLKWAAISQKRDRLVAMAALAQPDVAVTVDELDADPWAFNCLNGTIDLRTGELRPHRKEDLLTKLAPVEYDSNARCPRFSLFLTESFDADHELIRFVQRWHGHSLSADIREQLFLIYHGAGNNGKSVLLDTISAVMGDYAGEAPPDLVTVRKHPEHPTEIADLLGKRMVVASETEKDAELRVQLIKRLTGNARLKARHMRQDYFEFGRTHKMILVTNNKPSLREDTEAVWRRIRLVPFSIIIPKEKRDPDLLAKLRDEWPGILAWLVRGCVDWLREGLTEPQSVLVATDEYRTSANSIDGFITDSCTLGPTLRCPAADLIAAYGEWCAKKGRVPLLGKSLAAALKQKRCWADKFGGVRHWFGIALDGRLTGQNGQNGHEVPVKRLTGPREAVNGNVPSIPSIVSTDDSAPESTPPVTGLSSITCEAGFDDDGT